MKRTPHMCVICKNFEPYHCLLDDSYIGYLHCAEQTKCRAWRLSDNYKEGGKFYEKEKLHKYDCRKCVNWDSCQCGKTGHEKGTSKGFCIGECKDYVPM